jgi:hypothetical protein
MSGSKPDMVCFSSIDLSEPLINGKSVKCNVNLNKTDGRKNSFCIMLKYEEKVNDCSLPNLRLAFIVPMLNYGLFSKKLKLDFPICEKDFDLIKKLNEIFSRDIFVNKILRRRADYIIPSFLPSPDFINPDDSYSEMVIEPSDVNRDYVISSDMDKNSCGILSSGGKESLLTYGLINEIGCKTYPFYVNESGGHWRTAIPAYRYHKRNDKKTQRVWTNVDRFYVFMLDNLKFIRTDHRRIRADTYPIRLCIFPFYVFLLLPLFSEEKIGNLLIGSEFDDLRSSPNYKGIPHYYGIYDQHQDYDILMNDWYAKRIPGMYQWSAVRNISGLVVERILAKRYPHLAKLQRSCHSCHFEDGEIVPCGICSKCMGVILFLLANNIDPKIMKFKERDVISFENRVDSKVLRLDDDEKNQSFFLLEKKTGLSNLKPVDHVEKIHINKETCDIGSMPIHLRKKILDILNGYTTGYCRLINENWKSFNYSE